MPCRILIVDDDLVQLKLTSEVASRAGYVPVTAGSGAEALELLRADRCIGAVVLDLVMPDMDGMAVLEAMRRHGIAVPVIVQTASASLDLVTTAMRQGAVDYFVKPVAPERMAISLRNALRVGELETLVGGETRRRDGTPVAADLVAKSEGMVRVTMLIGKSARSPLPVLVEGEAGTGKRLIARTIHTAGERAGRPFVTVDCATLPEEGAEAVLFGRAGSPGRVQEAQGGTLYLDEVGDLPAAAQAGLLRLIEDGEVLPVGATRPIRVSVRIIAGTRRRLLNLARTGEIGEALYYRLNVLPIYAPPLRERREDIVPLLEQALSRAAAEAGRRVTGFSDAALELCRRHDWPGNVRQLQAVIHRAVALADGAVIVPADLPQLLAGRADAAQQIAEAISPSGPVHVDAATHSGRVRGAATSGPDRFLSDSGDVLPLADVERELIGFALRRHDYRMSQVARALGIGRSTLYRKLREYGFDTDMDSEAA